MLSEIEVGDGSPRSAVSWPISSRPWSCRSWGILSPRPCRQGRPSRLGAPAPADGIAVVTTPTGDAPLLQRLRRALAAAFPDVSLGRLEQQAQDVLGTSLQRWLDRELFARHLRAFERRPLLWQLQSGPLHGRRPAAFSCLIYGPRVDGDTLPTLGAQIVRPLRRALQAQRAAGAQPSVPGAAAAAARRHLDERIDGLVELEQRLARVAHTGFDTPALAPLTASEPVDGFCAPDRTGEAPRDRQRWLDQERRFVPHPDDGIRVNIAPLQRAGLLARDVLAKGDVERAIGDRARWRHDERLACRAGHQRRPSWWL